MGQRSQTETLAGIYQAFVQRRVWKQTELAKQLEVSTEVIRRVLHELREKGMPLDREEDHPHVYWTVPKDWFPGSVLFKREGIVSARLDAPEQFHPVDDAALDAYDKASLDGFNQGGAPTTFSFVVRDPEARWVKNNLLAGMRAEDLTEGIRVEVTTTSLVRLARFVVGLGGAATCETPALAGEVATLARGGTLCIRSRRRSGHSTRRRRFTMRFSRPSISATTPTPRARSADSSPVRTSAWKVFRRSGETDSRSGSGWSTPSSGSAHLRRCRTLEGRVTRLLAKATMPRLCGPIGLSRGCSSRADIRVRRKRQRMKPAFRDSGLRAFGR